MIRALLFDCDGVLADNEPLHFRALNEALRTEGIEVSSHDYATLIGMPDDAAFVEVLRRAGRTADGARLEALCRAKSESYLRSLEAGVVPVPGVADFVRRAAPTLLVAVASGGRRAEVDRVIAALGLAGTFRAIVAAEDCPQGKPSPAPFLLAVERLNASAPVPSPPVAARDCLVFEDSEHGIAAARAAGMRSIGITTSFTGEVLRDADLVAPNFRALDLARVTAFFDRRARA